MIDIAGAYGSLLVLSQKYDFSLTDKEGIQEEIDQGNDEIKVDLESFHELVESLNKAANIDEEKLILAKLKVVVMGLSTLFDNLNDEINLAIVGLKDKK